MSHTRLRPSFSFTDEKLAELRRVVPEAFADGQVNWESLREALGEYLEDDDAQAEHFGLNWPGKREARRMAGSPSKGALVPQPGKGMNEDSTRNVFIEGENLEVLKLLQKAYAGKVKMIYIDPPYNTGNDFVYEDDFTEPLEEYLRRTGQVDEEGKALTTNTRADGRFHSKWLSMMYPRLRLARQLLRDDGVIFVSIDDNEVHHLRALMSEVFGDENFLAGFIWRRRKTQANLAKNVAPVHDYIVSFAKHLDSVDFNRLPYSEEFIKKTFSNPDNDERGPYQTRPIAQPDNSTNKAYEVTLPGGRKLTAKWSCSPATFAEYVKGNRLVIPRDGKGMPRLKIFLSELEGFLPNTWLDDIATNEQGSAEIEELMGSNAYFSAPKPVKLIDHLLKLGSTKDCIVADFFAGSGTTGQAIQELNAADGGTRKFVLVQLPEPLDEKHPGTSEGFHTIADISRERLKRAFKKNKSEAGFLSYGLGKSHYHAWRDVEGADLTALEKAFAEAESPLVQDWSPEGLRTEVMLLEGFPLDSRVEKVAADPGSKAGVGKNEVHRIHHEWHAHALLVCLDKKVHADTIKDLQLADGDIFICLDTAIDDQSKLRLSDKGMIKTI